MFIYRSVLGRLERFFFTTEKIFTQSQEAAEVFCFSLQERRMHLHACFYSPSRDLSFQMMMSERRGSVSRGKILVPAPRWSYICLNNLSSSNLRGTQNPTVVFISLLSPEIQREKKGEMMRNCRRLGERAASCLAVMQWNMGTSGLVSLSLSPSV